MPRLYEVMFIVRPDAVEEDVDKLIAGFSSSVANGGGVVKTVEKMGRRKLAYTVRKFNDGNYVLPVSYTHLGGRADELHLVSAEERGILSWRIGYRGRAEELLHFPAGSALQ